MMSNYYGYCRVSSKKQWKKGTVQEQVEPVSNYLLKHGVNKKDIKKHIFTEQYTGMTMKRPKFQKMMSKVKNGDTIVVAKLDRLSRNGLNSMNFVKNHPHVTFVVLQPSMILSGDDKSSTKLIHDMLMLFEQFDHDAIMGRFNRGKARAKAMGKRNYNGGIAPRFYGKKKQYYISVYKYAQKHSQRNTAITFGISRRTVGRIKQDGKAYYSYEHKREATK